MANANKVALITGANKGLGLEIARQLGKQGITVVLGARDAQKGEAAAESLRKEGVDAHAVTLEVTNADHIAALPEFFETKFGRLDILVNNAGVNYDPEGVSVETFRKTFETNVYAPIALIEALLPLLQASESGRIVNHSSILGSLSSLGEASGSGWIVPAYSSSKAALNAITVVYAMKLKDTRVKINSAHPGWVKTDMGTDAAPLEVAEGAKTAVALATLPDDGPTGGFFHLGETLPW